MTYSLIQNTVNFMIVIEDRQVLWQDVSTPAYGEGLHLVKMMRHCSTTDYFMNKVNE